MMRASGSLIIPQRGELHFTSYRRLAPAVTRRIVCLRSGGEQGLCFLEDGVTLYGQATRGVVELARRSAQLLDRIIAPTDDQPQTSALLTVTEEMLQAAQ
jgi:hypothetical protein